MIDQRASMRKVGSDRGDTPVAEMNAQYPRDLPVRDVSRKVRNADGTQRQRMAETQQRVATVNNRREEFPRPADRVPVLREQQFQQRPLFVGRTAPVDGDRDK